MIGNLPRYSVYLITYNQQNTIKRALNSICEQKQWVYELIVIDDCSTDQNWEIIQQYSNKFPNLIKAYRNEKNIGIFNNIVNAWSKVTGDIVFSCAGDDELCNGIFEHATILINKHSIDIKKDLFCLYFDYKSIDPQGIEKKFSNKMISEGHDPVSLKLRNLIINRSIGRSINIVKLFKPVKNEFGIFTDGLLDIQVQLLSKKNYYFPFVGSIYYTGIGISANTKTDDVNISYISTLTEMEKMINFSKLDKRWIKYRKQKSNFEINPTVKKFFLTLFYFITSINYKYGLTGIGLKDRSKEFAKMLYKLVS